MDAVTQIVSLRAREADGLQRMLGASVLAHIVFVLVVFVAPASWFGNTVPTEPENVMTISLGGPVGPRTGMTAMGGRPIQQAVPVESKKAIEPIRPPAARAPEMIEPKKTAPKKSEAKIQESAKDPRGRTPTKGEEVRKGSSPAETGARGQGFGLSSGGGGTGSYLDTANFCCPEYISTMLDLIRRNWDSRQQSTGTATVKYTIQRDGTLTDIMVEKSSGYQTLDFLANRSLHLTRKLPPLPAAFTEPSLTVHLVFEYQR
jgi:TonB family protein